jgi:hypothetical protein
MEAQAHPRIQLGAQQLVRAKTYSVLIITLVVRRVETVLDRLELVETEVAVMVLAHLQLWQPHQDSQIQAAAAAAEIAYMLVLLVVKVL